MSEAKADFTDRLKSEATRLGFHLSGACPAVEPGGYHQLLDWIDSGKAGEMDYLDARRDAYRDPKHVMPGVQSLLVLGLPYRTAAPAETQPTEGRFARYAWGSIDYHDLVHQKLKTLKRWVLAQRPDAAVRGVVDTAPLLEREFAQLAGIGWTGKNTLLINKWQGSYFFLAALLVDFPLAYDRPHESDHCGKCRACIDACPTAAFPEPGVLDATRCISYLTIEHRSPIPRELRQPIGNWVFGCDVCQDVCPWNRRGSDAEEVGFQPLATQNPAELISLFSLTEDAFRARYRKTPLWRTRRRGLLRNAAIVLGNARTPAAINALAQGLVDPEHLVRGASAWALGQIATVAAKAVLRERRIDESDREVLAEIEAALANEPTREMPTGDADA
ncbi:Epoxyqueuosine reductase [Rosistilla carotiformis]|uniref:Epoxyqueuosine reductase n=1 Tax=Rosistilla carotiformis TaxID=2528017 RepID=A0A518JQG7_9BACT|nr:tRNA epoxyqueuosine(34) reductase QueG [Rosistilla carotiformis]QDV67783.1 Epoxyqueuosine reductase [Rosistilla carotiformis]